MSKSFGKLMSALLVVVLIAACSSAGSETDSSPAPSQQPANSGGNSGGGNTGGGGNSGGDAGIANFNATGYPIVNESIKLKLMGPRAANQGPWEEMDLFEEMERITGISFEFDTPPAESFQERKNLVLASGDYPDIFFASQLTTSDEINYGSQGILIPLENLIEQYAPNIKRMLDNNPDIRRSITTLDGHIYSLPQVTELGHNLINKTWVNGDWMAKAGVTKLPETLDEFYALLQAFKSSDANGNGIADEIPYSGNNIRAVATSMMPAFGFLSREFDVKDNTVRYGATLPEYKEYLIFLNKLYAEGLLDSEIFSHTAQQFTAKGKENKLGMFLGAAPFLVLDIKNDEDNFKHPALPPLTSQWSPEKLYPLNNPVRRGTFSITDKNPHPEATIRWVDYLYSEEGGPLGNSGIEGIGWKWLDGAKSAWDRNTVEGKNVEEFRGLNTPDSGGVIPAFKERAFHYKINNKVTQWLHKVSDEGFLDHAKMAFPLVYFTDEEQQRINVLMTDIQTYVDQMEARFIIGQEPIANWDSYIQTLEKMNIKELVAIHQAAYDRWNQ